jgi:hypothetical protein
METLPERECEAHFFQAKARKNRNKGCCYNNKCQKQWLFSPCEHDVQCPKSTEIYKNNNDSNFKGSYLPYIRKHQITQGLIEDYKIRR